MIFRRRTTLHQPPSDKCLMIGPDAPFFGGQVTLSEASQAALEEMHAGLAAIRHRSNATLNERGNFQRERGSLLT